MKKTRDKEKNYYKIILFEYILNKKVIIIFILLIIYFQIQLDIYFNNNYISNSLENNFAKYMCKVFILEINANCFNDIYINQNFYDNLKDVKQNLRLTLNNINKSKIENIIILIGLMPFIKGNSKIEYIIKNKDIYNYFKIYTNIKIKKNNIVSLTNSDYYYFNDKFYELLNYKWELIPNQYILNHLRYIVKNHYNTSCLNIFDNSLNLNFYYYIKKKKFFSFGKINDFISKYKTY